MKFWRSTELRNILFGKFLSKVQREEEPILTSSQTSVPGQVLPDTVTVSCGGNSPLYFSSFLKNKHRCKPVSEETDILVWVVSSFQYSGEMSSNLSVELLYQTYIVHSLHIIALPTLRSILYAVFL